VAWESTDRIVEGRETEEARKEGSKGGTREGEGKRTRMEDKEKKEARGRGRESKKKGAGEGGKRGRQRSERGHRAPRTGGPEGRRGNETRKGKTKGKREGKKGREGRRDGGRTKKKSLEGREEGRGNDSGMRRRSGRAQGATVVTSEQGKVEKRAPGGCGRKEDVGGRAGDAAYGTGSGPGKGGRKGEEKGGQGGARTAKMSGAATGRWGWDTGCQGEAPKINGPATKDHCIGGGGRTCRKQNHREKQMQLIQPQGLTRRDARHTSSPAHTSRKIRGRKQKNTAAKAQPKGRRTDTHRSHQSGQKRISLRIPTPR